jgi:hypothetical protein
MRIIEFVNMTHKETIERNIGLTFDFVSYLMDNKAEVEKLPDNFNLEFIEKDFSKLQHKRHQAQSQNTISKFVKVRNSFDTI